MAEFEGSGANWEGFIELDKDFIATWNSGNSA